MQVILLLIALHVPTFESAQDQLSRQLPGHSWRLTSESIKYYAVWNEVDIYFYRATPDGFDSKTITIKNIYREDILISSITKNPSHEGTLVLRPSKEPKIGAQD